MIASRGWLAKHVVIWAIEEQPRVALDARDDIQAGRRVLEVQRDGFRGAELAGAERRGPAATEPPAASWPVMRQ